MVFRRIIKREKKGKEKDRKKIDWEMKWDDYLGGKLVSGEERGRD